MSLLASESIWDAAVALDKTVLALDEGQRLLSVNQKPSDNCFRLVTIWKMWMFVHYISTVFSDFDDYWSPFLGGQGPVPSYVGSLSEGPRVALREKLRLLLPIASDDSTHVKAHAWAVRGVRRN